MTKDLLKLISPGVTITHTRIDFTLKRPMQFVMLGDVVLDNNEQVAFISPSLCPKGNYFFGTSTLLCPFFSCVLWLSLQGCSRTMWVV